MITEVAKLIKNARRVCAFTGAGISVESGIPPFRGKDGLWSKYDPQILDIDFFYNNPHDSWKVIKEIFYDFFGTAKPNDAHKALAKLEQKGLLHSIVTQNIDNLHQEAGSKNVFEFHGTASRLVCLDCKRGFFIPEIDFNQLPPPCPNCKTGLIKPDFVFFGEGINQETYQNSFFEAQLSDVFIVVGTTGEVMPASMVVHLARAQGASVIEVNLTSSSFTSNVTTHFLPGKATEIMNQLISEIEKSA